MNRRGDTELRGTPEALRRMLGHNRHERAEHVVAGGPRNLATAPMQRTSTNEGEEQTLRLLEEMLANIPDVLGVYEGVNFT